MAATRPSTITGRAEDVSIVAILRKDVQKHNDIHLRLGDFTLMISLSWSLGQTCQVVLSTKRKT